MIIPGFVPGVKEVWIMCRKEYREEVYQRFPTYKEAVKPFFDWLDANNLDDLDEEDKLYEAWKAGKEVSHESTIHN